MNNLFELIRENPKFLKYYSYLISENEKYNLTNITQKDEVYVKHFLDSALLLELLDLKEGVSLCDVGSGAGFPGIPIKILRPDIKLTIIEPTLKRCNFLNNLVQLLDLTDVTIINKRAEDIKDMKFDIVCARAVSNLRILLELCMPLVKVNWSFIAYKGSKYQEEIDESVNALKVLNSKITNVFEYNLDEYLNGSGNHCLIQVTKYKEIDNKYPRSYSKIKSKPL